MLYEWIELPENLDRRWHHQLVTKDLEQNLEPVSNYFKIKKLRAATCPEGLGYS